MSPGIRRLGAAGEAPRPSKNEMEAGRERWRLLTLYEMVAVERHDSIVQVRAVVLPAMLAMLSKLIVLDLAATDAGLLLALSAAMLALGLVYWLVREQDQRRAAKAPR
jgi:hypothetical protein